MAIKQVWFQQISLKEALQAGIASASSEDVMEQIVGALLRAEKEGYVIEAEFAALQKTFLMLSGYKEYLPKDYVFGALERSLGLQTLAARPASAFKLAWLALRIQLREWHAWFGRLLGAVPTGAAVPFQAAETVIGQVTVNATGRPLLIMVTYFIGNPTVPQKGFSSRIRVDGTGTNGAVVITHGGGVQALTGKGSTLVCVHTPAAGQRRYYFTLWNQTNNAVMNGQVTQISVTELVP